MPLSVNVGLSRKASRDYQSTGVSINVTAELDQSLLAKPAELQEAVAGLYEQASEALDRQVQQHGDQGQNAAGVRDAGGRDSGRDVPASRNGNGHADGSNAARRYGGNGAGNGNGGRGNAMMTASQRRAIEAICRRLGSDPVIESREVMGSEFGDLSLRQASELIDHLRASSPAGR